MSKIKDSADTVAAIAYAGIGVLMLYGLIVTSLKAARKKQLIKE
jgi:hypothetical protein